MLKLGIVAAEFHGRTVLETEAEAVLPDRLHRRDLPVGEPGGGIVACEAHLVATAKLQALAPIDLDTALCRRDTGGFPVNDVAEIVFQMDGWFSESTRATSRRSPLSTPRVVLYRRLKITVSPAS